SVSPQAVSAMDTEGMQSSEGNPVHYFVFDYLSDHSIQPRSYQQVEMSDPMQSLSAGQLVQALNQASRNQTQLGVVLQDRFGFTLFRDVVSFSPWLRGEFASESGQGIDGHLLQPKTIPFVVRLPMMAASRLLIQDRQLHTLAEYDLAGLIAFTRHIQPGEIPITAQQRTINGSPANRVDLVVLGDGYTAAQAGEFISDSQDVISDFFSITPLQEYANYFNLYSLMVVSPQSGADHPPYNDQCGYTDPTCCGDPAMQGDPLEGQMVNTAFDSRFCAFWIHRLLVANYSKVVEAAAAIPDWDTLLLLVNDGTYGGSGGSRLAVISMHSLAVDVAQHEFGHSFGDLADEYDSDYPGYPNCSDDPSLFLPPCETNVTDITVRQQIKWLPWILNDTFIPTPENPIYDGLVGLFEGARYRSTGMYRSGLYCLMKSLGEPFCQVPSQSMVLKLYQGGWGIPWDGIRLIEPGSTQPITPTLNLTHPATEVFSADLLGPVGGPPLEVTWLDNGLPIPGATTQVFTYTTRSNASGLHEITLRVRDATSLVNPLMDQDELDMQHTWMVDVSVPMTLTISADPPSIPADGVSTATITANVMSVDGPVVGDVVTFTTDLGEVSPITVTTDISGTATTVLTSSSLAGTAIVRVSLHGHELSVQVDFTALLNSWLPIIRRP
ncbi:MAG TPA: M64 family metallopeptidase, partial [Anaerolineales bacterium]|nr:M64 family metallopeptidase [Anaerolineales bacterium]